MFVTDPIRSQKINVSDQFVRDSTFPHYFDNISLICEEYLSDIMIPH